MLYLTALLPVRDGVGVVAALRAAAATAQAAGDPRTRDQLIADTLVARVTGAQTTWRRLYTRPDTGALVTMESRARLSRTPSPP